MHVTMVNERRAMNLKENKVDLEIRKEREK